MATNLSALGFIEGSGWSFGGFKFIGQELVCHLWSFQCSFYSCSFSTYVKGFPKLSSLDTTEIMLENYY